MKNSEIIAWGPDLSISEDAFVRQRVQQLGNSIGYGALMHAVQLEWRKVNVSNQMEGSEFLYGPCVAFSVVCGCRLESKNSCDWCCGSGWLTKRVREAQIQAENNN